MDQGLVQALMELIPSAGVVEALEVQEIIQEAILIQGLVALASCASGYTRKRNNKLKGERLCTTL